MKSDRIRYRSPYFENVNEDPEYEVNKVLAQIGWDGTIPIDLIEICDMYAFDVKFDPVPEMKEEGTTKFRQEGEYYILLNTHGTDCEDGFSSDRTRCRRQRFTLAHEIAHCIYKSHTDIELQCNLQHPSNPHARNYTRKREEQANLFAAHLLIPRKAFKDFSRSIGWNNIAKLIHQTSESFDVSIEVAIQQIARLADFPCIAILFKQDGSPLRTPSYSPDFSETGLFYGKSQDVPSGTVAAQMLAGQKNSKQVQRKYQSASIWFPDMYEWKTEKFSVTETSISNGRYGVVSFLEIEELDI